MVASSRRQTSPSQSASRVRRNPRPPASETAMSEKFVKTKPSLMEAGLPCSSLSAECQRDNNARERPPQNRLHIWWARRPPTVCRVAILTALLPHDVELPPEVLPSVIAEPSTGDRDKLP